MTPSEIHAAHLAHLAHLAPGPLPVRSGEPAAPAPSEPPPPRKLSQKRRGSLTRNYRLPRKKAYKPDGAYATSKGYSLDPLSLARLAALGKFWEIRYASHVLRRMLQETVKRLGIKVEVPEE